MQCKTMSVKMKKGQHTIVSVAFEMSFDDLSWAGWVMVKAFHLWRASTSAVRARQVHWKVISEHLAGKDQIQCKHGCWSSSLLFKKNSTCASTSSETETVSSNLKRLFSVFDLLFNCKVNDAFFTERSQLTVQRQIKLKTELGCVCLYKLYKKFSIN